jgi:ABC-type multidrug transport system fused ATPase/permease subunit
MKDFLKQFVYLLDAQAKRAIPFLLIAFIFASILDVVGIGLIGLFLGLLTNPHYYLQKFPQIASLIYGVSEQRLVCYAGLTIIGAFIAKAILTLVIQTRVVFFCQTFSVRLKTRLMRAYQHAPYTYHLKKNSADLLSVIQNNVGSYINSVLLATLNFLSNAIIATFILLFLLISHPLSTSLLLGMFMVVGFGYDLASKKKLLAMGELQSELSGAIIKSVNEGLHGFTEIRVLGRETYFLESLNKVSVKFAHSAGVLTALQQVPRYLIENIIAIFIISLSLGGIALGHDAATVVAMVGMFAVAGARLLPTVNQIMTTISQVRGSYSNMNLIYQDLHELDQINAEYPVQQSLVESPDKLSFSNIHLKNVRYQYSQTKYSALQEINIEIIKGQSVGLIGPSGAGKSTLVNIILGLLVPQQGQLLVDGRPITNTRAWLNNFAYIPQAIYLLDDTVRRNIALGVNDVDIDEAKIWHAISMAQLMDVIQQLPEGLNTHVGENGVRLSGGQRQRIALARAFYHERDIIILDEATSSLDNDTEREVINTIKRLKGNKTLIVIAHRLSTVEHCDVLFRLERGSVAAVGSFQEVVN